MHNQKSILLDGYSMGIFYLLTKMGKSKGNFFVLLLKRLTSISQEETDHISKDYITFTSDM